MSAHHRPKYENLWQVFVARAGHGHPMLSIGGETITWTEFLVRARRVAQVLGELGVGRGSRVATLGETTLEIVTVSLAVAKLGAVEIPLNTGLRGALLAHPLAHSKSTFAVVAASHVEYVVDVLDEGVVSDIVVLGDAVPARRGAGRATMHSLDEMLAAATSSAGGDDNEPGLIDPVCVIYTSGTTGPAKGVVLSHGYFINHAARKEAHFGLTPDDVLYSCLPLFHVNARVVTLYTAAYSGAGLVIDPRFSATAFWSRIGETGATFFTFLGNMAAVLLARPAGEDERSHRARIAYGSPVPDGRDAEFEARFGVRLAGAFGMTEAMGVMLNPPGEFVPGSLGRELPDFETKIMDHTQPGRECDVGEIGELFFRPRLPNLFMSEYLDDPQATVEAWRDLWFHTGDLVRRDADGYHWLCGRVKESMRRRGENISAWEVESVVSRHPHVEECAAIGVPSELGEEEVKLVVVPTDRGAVRADVMLAQLVDMLPRHIAPRYLELVDVLPKTPTARVKKYELRQHWRSSGTWDREAGAYLPDQR